MEEDKEKEIKIDLKWLDDTLDKLNSSEQFDLFKNDLYFDNKYSASAGTISHAAGNVWPYPYVNTNTGTYTLTSGTGTGLSNISPGLTFSDSWRLPEQSLHVRGDADFEGDIKLKGKSLSDTLDKIEERLAILHPNEKLEAKWEELKKLGDAYRALEKDIQEKEKIWEMLKK